MMQQTPAETLGAVLDLVAPPVTEAEARDLAAHHFGLHGAVSALTGERDRNFRLRGVDGRDYVLKVAHPDEDAAVIDMQSRALLHIALRDPDLPVPRLLPPLSGAGTAVNWPTPQGQPRLVRVLSFLPGAPLAGAELQPAQSRQIGRFLARLDLALQDFSHPAQGHDLLWDLQHVLRVRGLLAAVADPSDRALALRYLDQFEAQAAGRMAGLRRQVIHNDLNPHNILADSAGRILGVIDFGDLVHAPRVQDFAVAAAYHIAPGPDPLVHVAAMAAAYHAENPFTDAELDILPQLLAARLVLSVGIASWRAARQPENAGYILRNLPKAWTGLRGLETLTPAQTRAALRHACGKACEKE